MGSNHSHLRRSSSSLDWFDLATCKHITFHFSPGSKTIQKTHLKGTVGEMTCDRSQATNFHTKRSIKKSGFLRLRKPSSRKLIRTDAQPRSCHCVGPLGPLDATLDLYPTLHQCLAMCCPPRFHHRPGKLSAGKMNNHKGYRLESDGQITPVVSPTAGRFQ